ncbi:MAG: histidine phosphatase family protein [Chloroflexi bacterium]|nr:histidine phosphatase family protein [Chloroflexota bacterium]
MRSVAYLVRHGEVEHHRTDVSITARGHEQAVAAGRAIAERVSAGDTVQVYRSTLARNVETADSLVKGLSESLAAKGGVTLHAPQVEEFLHNVRFALPDQPPQEPSLLYALISDPAYRLKLQPGQIDYYNGFYASKDPMGYWMTRDPNGWADTTAEVWGRFRGLLARVLNGDGFQSNGNPAARAHWIGVTHSGAMRVIIREAFGSDPGEPDFCGIITVEPSADPLRPTLIYRGQSVPLSLADSA